MDRRDFVRQVGLGLIATAVGGGSMLLTPRQARAQDAPFNVLKTDEVALLEAFAEVLLPGAAAAGVAHFIDYHLAQPPPDCLLMLRYLDIPPPYAPFYSSGLGNLEALSQRLYAQDFTGIDAAQRRALVASIVGGQPEGWQGFPAPLFYFALRSDAVDVVYGTEEGFEKLGVPYMAHIAPPSKW
ncbi:MAG: gluconate 2-dehydrogenase subunit 3 family protein [Halioglobus sp.]|nr:gluconate 2-dehydrogenase subunit 3 family protein [Halioglobus sp.]